MKADKLILKKDIVIPAGTVFGTAPHTTRRYSYAIDCVVSLNNPDSSGNFTFYPEEDDLNEWFIKE